MSPERERDRGGSLSPELVHRGGSLSPDPYRPMTEDELVYHPRRSANSTSNVNLASLSMSPAEEAHWLRAYSLAELKTFHCERVRKMYSCMF